MGDDTWTTVFPTAFQPNLSFPYDSFNVEDLHTVDAGVVRHLFPLLDDNDDNDTSSKPFDVLIGHFLGVDHVGHRVGPDHPSMRAKLAQMNDVLTRVVHALDDDTLLIVLGDHGMDRSGDHGGDGDLETSAGLWIYSSTRPIVATHPVPPTLLRYSTFPGSTHPARTIQQIDLVPSLSLLLGLPIPFNNLGTVIPDLFWRDDNESHLVRALDINAAQIKHYLDAYRASVSGGELDDVWPQLQSAWAAISADAPSLQRSEALQRYTRLALESCRSLWAQFNPVLMGLGLVLLGTSLVALWSLCAAENGSWNGVRCLGGIAAGAAVGFSSHAVAKSFLPGVDALDCALFGGGLLSCFLVIAQQTHLPTHHLISASSIPLVLHTTAFLSNSFTFWEDRIVPFLLVSSITPFVLVGFAAPIPRLRHRILGFSLLFATCVRLIAISTVCREEQQPYCHVTFFASSSHPSPPLPVLLLALPVSFVLPSVIARFLRISRSDAGVAPFLLSWILRPALVAGSVYWLVEYADAAGIVGDDWLEASRGFRTAVARLAMTIPLIGGIFLWWPAPLCLEIDNVRSTQDQDRDPHPVRQVVTVLGFANASGAPYVVLWSLALGVVYATTQLSGQIVLALGTLALLAHLEVVDSVRDARRSLIRGPTNDHDARIAIQLDEVVPLALLGWHLFFGTGHQAVFATIQWKSAFLLTPTVVYPFAPLTVLINSFGSLVLAALAVPLLALWNRAPRLIADGRSTKPQSSDGPHSGRVDAAPVLAALGMMAYFTSLLFGSAVSAAILRRHLMVWKVFAPRFIYSVVALLVVDVSVLFGVGVGVARVQRKVSRIFGSGAA